MDKNMFVFCMLLMINCATTAPSLVKGIPPWMDPQDYIALKKLEAETKNSPVGIDTTLPTGYRCRILGALTVSDTTHNHVRQIEGLKTACREMGGNHVVVPEKILYGTESYYTITGKCYLCE